MYSPNTWLNKAEQHLACLKHESPSLYVRHKNQVADWHRSSQEMQQRFEYLIQELDTLHALVKKTLSIGTLATSEKPR